MKSEERHKLKHNQLADYMDRASQSLKKNAGWLIGGAVLLVVVGVIVAVLIVRSQARTREAWNSLDAAIAKLEAIPVAPNRIDPSEDMAQLQAAADKLAEVADRYPDTAPVTALAYYYRGYALARQAGIRGMTADREQFLALVEKAEESLNKALEQPYHSTATPGARIELAGLAMDRATTGGQGQLDRARELLTAVINDPQAASAMKWQAERARASLPTSLETVEFVKAPPATERDIDLDDLTPRIGPAQNLPLPPMPSGPDTGEPTTQP